MKKKEVQGKILESSSGKITEEEMLSILKMVAPGTNLRGALEGILHYGKGALIAIENPGLPELIEGGFRINSRFTPQKMVELAKMDGAIIISKDIKRILYSNVLLTPNHKLKSVETGTRHKAAERTAKQTQGLVIAISQGRKIINLYYKNIRYRLVNSGDLLRKANEHIQLLEKQRELFDHHLDKLTELELKNLPSFKQSINVIQKGILIEKIGKDLKRYIIELGNEGVLLKTRLREITSEIEKETSLVIKDYSELNQKKSRQLLEDLSYEEMLDRESISKILSVENSDLSPKGWRLLSKTSLNEKEIAEIISQSNSIGKAIHSPITFYEQIVGIDKARSLKQDLERIKLNS
jgi:diadenylate cyclase